MLLSHCQISIFIPGHFSVRSTPSELVEEGTWFDNIGWSVCHSDISRKQLLTLNTPQICRKDFLIYLRTLRRLDRLSDFSFLYIDDRDLFVTIWPPFYNCSQNKTFHFHPNFQFCIPNIYRLDECIWQFVVENEKNHRI